DSTKNRKRETLSTKKNKKLAVTNQNPKTANHSTVTLPKIKTNLADAKFSSILQSHHNNETTPKSKTVNINKQSKREKTCYSIPCFLSLPIHLSFQTVRSDFALVGATSFLVAPSSALPRSPAATSSLRRRGDFSRAF
ncbi:hypothetical protein VIGAN_11116200, partial [Vigna angularis var. angularis]